jgi:hypothetical protein
MINNTFVAADHLNARAFVNPPTYAHQSIIGRCQDAMHDSIPSPREYRDPHQLSLLLQNHELLQDQE